MKRIINVLGGKLINNFLQIFRLRIMRLNTYQKIMEKPEMVAGHFGNIDLLKHQISIKWDIIDYIESNLSESIEHVCPLCSYSGGIEFKKYETQCIFGGGKLIRYQCPHCDLIFGPYKMLIMDPAKLKQEYKWHYSVYSEGDTTNREIQVFMELKPKKEDNIYLNYGCGNYTKTLNILNEQGWQVYGFDPYAPVSSPYAIDNFEELNRLRFDGIFSNNLLEHLSNPVKDLRYMVGLLKPSGKMVHATPCYEYLYEYTRFHLFFYLGNSKYVLAEKAGLLLDYYERDGEYMFGVFEKKQ